MTMATHSIQPTQKDARREIYGGELECRAPRAGYMTHTTMPAAILLGVRMARSPENRVSPQEAAISCALGRWTLLKNGPTTASPIARPTPEVDLKRWVR